MPLWLIKHDNVPSWVSFQLNEFDKVPFSCPLSALFAHWGPNGAFLVFVAPALQTS